MNSLDSLRRVSDCKWSKEHIEEADALVKWLSGKEASEINYLALHGEVDGVQKTIPLIRKIAHFILDAAEDLQCPPSVNAILGIVDAEVRKQGDIDIRIVALAAIFKAGVSETMEATKGPEEFRPISIMINPNTEKVEADPPTLQFFADELGLPYEMLDNLSLSQIFHPRSLRLMKQGILRICRTSLESVSFECILCGHNQQKKFSVNVVLEQQSSGEIAVAITDNSKQAALKKQLRHSQKVARLKSGQYEQLFKETPVALMEVDFSASREVINALIQLGVEDLRKHLSGHHDELFNLVRKLKVMRVNAKTREIIGVDRKDVVSDFEEYCTKETIEALIEFFVALSEGRDFSETETTIRTAEGDTRKVMARLISVPDSDSGLSRTLLSVVDITEMAKREERRRGDLVNMLAAGISHELNNTVARISGAADLIEKGAKVDENIKRIQDACNRSREIIDELLKISLKQDAEPHVYNLAEEVLREMATSIRGYLNRPEVEITTECPKDIGNIRIDIQQLKEAFSRLALNSSDAMPDGGRLILRASNEGRNVLVEVIDSGAGISGEHQSKVFDPFFTTKEVGKGKGMGLSVVKALIEQNNGEIEIESIPGVGTKVKMRFPRVEGVRKSQRIDMRKLIPESLKGRGSIGVVATSRDFGNLCETMLTRCGYTVVVFESEEELMGMNGDSPDLILVDIALSSPDGWERQLVEEHPKLKIIYMGNSDDESAVYRTALKKPFRVERLATAIKQTLAQPDLALQ
ncbi:ATP-binding protein [Patescibacteria group bacterium]